MCFVVLLTATRTRCVGCQSFRCVVFSHHFHKACRVKVPYVLCRIAHFYPHQMCRVSEFPVFPLQTIFARCDGCENFLCDVLYGLPLPAPGVCAVILSGLSCCVAMHTRCVEGEHFSCVALYTATRTRCVGYENILYFLLCCHPHQTGSRGDAAI